MFWANLTPSSREAFERIDADGSGTLDREELTAILINDFGLQLNQLELEDAFAELDADGNGEISHRR
jgi:Ca2+-binding EF-hand superfamily protein